VVPGFFKTWAVPLSEGPGHAGRLVPETPYAGYSGNDEECRNGFKP
jgi:hypothetical protein